MRKIQQSQHQQWGPRLAELATVQQKIQSWYRKAAEKVQHQARVDEFQMGENTRIYHHEIHKKHLKKSSILKLETSSGMIEGHKACAEYLENLVADLLLVPAELDFQAQETLLAEVETVVTEAENEMLAKPPNKEDVKETLWNSNLSAAPGTDGITGLFYKVCWEAMGDALTQVALANFMGEKLPASMRTAMMVFGTKPKKAKSLQPKDKRRISLLNCDFKLLEGLDAKKFRKVNSKGCHSCCLQIQIRLWHSRY